MGGMDQCYRQSTCNSLFLANMIKINKFKTYNVTEITTFQANLYEKTEGNHEWMLFSGVNDTGDKREKFSGIIFFIFCEELS